MDTGRRADFCGLTGGIGSGKSAVASRLQVNGATIINSDALAREVVAPGSDGLAEIVEAFGTEVLAADGSLDRRALADIVFDDPDRRRRLEEIVHPRVRARTAEIADAAPADAVVVNDIPLLVEAGLSGAYDLVIVVLADAETRIARLVRDRGVSEADARARINAQATDDERRAVADIVIVNDGTLADLAKTVDAIWAERLASPIRPV